MSHQVLFNRHEIKKRVRTMGRQIARHYHDQETEDLVVLSVLKGATIFTADLIREMDISMELVFAEASSYGNGRESGDLQLTLPSTLFNKHILIVEDIVATGQTMRRLLNDVRKQQARSIELCTLLYHPDATVGKTVRWTGFRMPPDIFVAGYGLDDKGLMRNHPDIVILEDAR